MAGRIVRTKMQITGMSCVNCKKKIEGRLKSASGVSKAEVDYKTGVLEIFYNKDLIDEAGIEKIIIKAGYGVLHDSDRKALFARSVILAAVIIALYLLAEVTGVLNLLVPSRLADSSMGYLMLFVTGLLTSVHCIAMCGGINLSQSLSSLDLEETGKTTGLPAQKKPGLMPAVLYNAGRVVSYTLIGFALGLAGMLLGTVLGTGISSTFQGFVKIAAGILMVVMGINLLGIFPAVGRFALRLPKPETAGADGKRKGGGKPFFVGMLNGLMPCGPLQSMQLVALALQNPLVGALSMFMFSLGTVPLMLGFGTIVSVIGRKHAKKVMTAGAVLVTVMGFAMLSQGTALSGVLSDSVLSAVIILFCLACVLTNLPVRQAAVRKGLSAAAAVSAVVLAIFVSVGSGTASSDTAVADGGAADAAGGIQYVESTLQRGSYPDIEVEAGTTVSWTIHADESVINGCNYRMVIQEYDLTHDFTEGDNVITFTPEEPGTYTYSCWMGMIKGTITVV